MNTNFTRNNADYFGGAIYSDFNSLNLSKIENIYFIENHAYAGGAIYTNNNCNNTLFDVYNKKITYNDNKSGSHGDNFATGPHIINNMTQQNLNQNKITITSGESFPLEFILNDEYSQNVYDMSKYYSNIFLKLVQDDDKDDNEELDFKINGNICYFSKGNINIINKF